MTIALGFLAILLFLLTTFLPLSVTSYSFTILHNNDLHSRFASTDIDSSPCDESTSNRCIAGVARTAQAVKDIRNATDPSHPILFLAAGDFYQGTLWYTYFKDEIMSTIVPYMGYDVISLGNHEFDDGPDGLAPFVNSLMANGVSVVCANLNITKEPKLKNIRPSVVLTRNDRKIGVIGYLTPDTSFLTDAGETVTFEDEIAGITREVDLLKKQGVNIIIAVGHSGYVRDLEIAKAIPDIDILVGGHTNDFLWNEEDGPLPSLEKPVGRYPTIVNHNDGRKTLLITAYAFGKYLGRLDVDFDDEGQVVKFSGRPILMTSQLPKDPVLDTKVSKYQQELDEKFSEVIGMSAVSFEGDVSACRRRECSVGNIVSDAIVSGFLGKNKDPNLMSWTQYPLAVFGSGDIFESYSASQKKGKITLEDVIAILPFANNIVANHVKGQVLWDMFENSVSQYENFKGRFLQVAGIQVTYDLKKPVGKRVVSINVRCGDCQVPKFEPINLDKQYKLLTTDYISKGGDGFTMLTGPDVKQENFDKDVHDLVIKYIQSKGTITTGLEGRIRLV